MPNVGTVTIFELHNVETPILMIYFFILIVWKNLMTDYCLCFLFKPFRAIVGIYMVRFKAREQFMASTAKKIFCGGHCV